MSFISFLNKIIGRQIKYRFVLVHGFAATPDMYWMPWLKKKLEDRGFYVVAPELPRPFQPSINEWVDELKKYIGEPNKRTIFVGHSLGCQAIMRFLEKTEVNKVGGAIFVAPYLVSNQMEAKILKTWLDTPMDFERIKRKLPRSTAVFSNDDLLVPAKNKNYIHEKLGSKVVQLGKHGHFGASELEEIMPTIYSYV